MEINKLQDVRYSQCTEHRLLANGETRTYTYTRSYTTRTKKVPSLELVQQIKKEVTDGVRINSIMSNHNLSYYHLQKILSMPDC